MLKNFLKFSVPTITTTALVAFAAPQAFAAAPAASDSPQAAVVKEGDKTEATPYIAWREVYSVYNTKQECEHWRSVRDAGDEDHHYWCELTGTNTWALMYRVSLNPF